MGVGAAVGVRVELVGVLAVGADEVGTVLAPGSDGLTTVGKPLEEAEVDGAGAEQAPSAPARPTSAKTAAGPADHLVGWVENVTGRA